MIFIDKDFFDYISQFNKQTFNPDLETSKLTQPFRKEIKLKDAFPDYAERQEFTNSDPEEIGYQFPKPTTPEEALKYLVECDGKLSFLYRVNEFLKTYETFKDTFLLAWKAKNEKKESRSKQPDFISESFECKNLRDIWTLSIILKPEHYYCRLRNDFYSMHPDQLLKGGIYDAGHVANEFGQIMFYEFANYLLSKENKQPKNQKASIPEKLSTKEQQDIIDSVNKEIIHFMIREKMTPEEKIRCIDDRIFDVKTNRPKTPHSDYYIELLEQHLARLKGTAAKKYIYKNIDQEKSDSPNDLTHSEIDNLGIEVFGTKGYKFFKYIDKNYTQDDNHRVAKYSYIFRFLKQKQLIKVKQDSYKSFILKYSDTKMSKILPSNERYKYNDIESILTDFYKIFFPKSRIE